MSGLDRRAAGRGALVALAVLVPPVAVIRALLGSESDSPLWSLVVLAFLFSFVAGGAVAARHAPQAPVVNGAAAGALAFGVALAAAVIRNAVTGRSMGMAAVVTAVVFLQIAASLGALGGLAAARRRRQRQAEELPR